MDKIRRYNQIVLAIAGTMAILLCMGASVVLAVEMSGQFGWGRTTPSGIPSDEIAASRPRREVPFEVVSFPQMEVVDSAAKVYCLPVTQAGSPDGASSRGYFAPTPPLANNLLLRFGRTNELLPIFDDRVGIMAFDTELIGGERWLFITATSADSNRDGMLNAQDLQDLYVYRVSKRKLMQFPQEHGTYLGRLLTHDATAVYLRYGMDQNKDGWYDHSREPKLVYQVNLLTGDCESLIPSELVDDLQRRLDGYLPVPVLPELDTIVHGR